MDEGSEEFTTITVLEEHTPNNPYCGDVSCWCHTNLDHHSLAQDPVNGFNEDDYQHAYAFYGVGR